MLLLRSTVTFRQCASNDAAAMTDTTTPICHTTLCVIALSSGVMVLTHRSKPNYATLRHSQAQNWPYSPPVSKINEYRILDTDISWRNGRPWNFHYTHIFRSVTETDVSDFIRGTLRSRQTGSILAENDRLALSPLKNVHLVGCQNA